MLIKYSKKEKKVKKVKKVKKEKKNIRKKKLILLEKISICGKIIT